MDSRNSSTTKPLFRGVQVVQYLFGALEVLLAFRFILRLLAANPNAGFTRLIYDLSYPFAAPFLTVFRITYIEGSVFEWTTLLAMAVYALIEVGIVRFFVMSRSVSTVQAARKLEEHDEDL